MKKLYLLLSVFAIAALLLAACQQPGTPIPDDPVEALLLISDKQAEVKSAHLDATLNATINVEGDDPSIALFKDLDISAEATGDVDTAGQMQLAGNLDLGPFTAFLSNGADKIDFEMRLVDGKFYIKGLGQDWTEQALDGNFNFDSSAENPLNPAAMRKLFEQAANVERLGNEGIDGADTYHFKVTLDADALLDMVAATPDANMSAEDLAQAKQLLSNSQFEIEMWAGSQDLYIRQERIRLLLDLSDFSALAAQTGGEAPQIDSFKLDFTLLFKLSNQNQPVNISAP
jgi:hypothetical protein